MCLQLWIKCQQIGMILGDYSVSNYANKIHLQAADKNEVTVIKMNNCI